MDFLAVFLKIILSFFAAALNYAEAEYSNISYLCHALYLVVVVNSCFTDSVLNVVQQACFFSPFFQNPNKKKVTSL